MELGTTYMVLAYVGPICGIIGFIITPGLTHIRPWLLEKFNKDKKEMTKGMLEKDYASMHTVDLIDEMIKLRNNYKFDFRKSIRNRRKALSEALKVIKPTNCEGCEGKGDCNK
jgi:hypothetical protein